MSPWKRPSAVVLASVVVIIALGLVLQIAIWFYRGQMIETGLTADERPVELAIAAETLTIPANMLRSGKTRDGGPMERADIALHWPDFAGYTKATAEAFKDGSPAAPVIYGTIAARDAPVDSTGRLDSVYAQFFSGSPVAGPGGLVGRRLDPESGYDGEIVFFTPSEPRPFVARCLEESTVEIPATCIRDVHFGRSLSLFYRFDRKLLADWRILEAGMRQRAEGFLAPP